MADPTNAPQQPDFIPPIGQRGGTKSVTGGGVLEKFRALPKQVQLIIAGALFVVVFLVFGGGSSSSQQEGQQSGAVNTTTADAARRDMAADDKGIFSGLETDRPALFQNWLEQNRREMSELKDTLEKRFQERDQAMSEGLQRSAELQREMRQMMTDFTAELRSIQSANARDREVLGQLAEEQKKIQLNTPTDGSTGAGVSAGGAKRERINQTPLGSAPVGGAAPAIGSDKAFLAPIANIANNGLGEVSGNTDDSNRPKPFIPPLGFIKGTMLNGVDALVGGTPTPALVRLSGSYKTAMNSSVKLDGCFVLIEFQGEISTERAVGKPSRMTCVYPDYGAVTYGVSGYVVDAEDGIIGVPGVFYEGDASRIAAAMLADFAAGVGQVIAENQTTQTTTPLGGNTTALTGSEAKAELAGGADKAMSSLRDYLMERVNRVLPFVRLDATREMHIVLLSGNELRSQGNAWTLLFDAEAAEDANAAEVGAANGQQGEP